MGAGWGYPVAEERRRGAGHRRPDFRVAAGGRGALLAGHEDSEDRGAGSQEGHPREPKHEDHTGLSDPLNELTLWFAYSVVRSGRCLVLIVLHLAGITGGHLIFTEDTPEEAVRYHGGRCEESHESKLSRWHVFSSFSQLLFRIQNN